MNNKTIEKLYREAMKGGNNRTADKVSEGNKQRDEAIKEQLNNGRNPYAKAHARRLEKLKKFVRSK